MNWRFTVVLLIIVAGSGCTPRVDLRVRQKLLPNPTTECLGSALSRSPDVVQVPRLERAYGSLIFWVILRDSTAQDGQRTATVTRPAPPDSGGKVEVNFVWFGTQRPARAEEDAVISLGNRVLERLRGACAPQTPTRIECDYGDGRTWLCAQPV